MRASDVRAAMRALADPERAVNSARFFKTGPGQYGEGDRFMGITVPEVRKVARAYAALPLAECVALLESPWHEERLVALLILVAAHERGTTAEREAIHRAYLAHTDRVNNWDLVDTSASVLVGSHVPQKGIKLLERLAKSDSLWERRIAMIATLWTIRQDDFAPTIRIAERLLGDTHDLMHKAVGWMLREMGKRDEAALTDFLDTHAARMPRTALRYAIERLSESRKRRYMAIPRASR
jgi:3-methyladenine DNA glycosylase AlkD